MGGSRDLDDVRPASQQRPASVSANSFNSSRPHAHSVSAGALNPNYRVNRRKSSSSMVGINIPALTAAAKEAYAHTSLKGQPEIVGVPGNAHTREQAAKLHDRVYEDKSSSVLVDGPPLSVLGDKATGGKIKARRASEGTRLTRSDRRRSTAGELRCDKCGKGYKHGSCLQKHLWEHTPEWSLTSKLLISKHQQVQLLEAASVLVNMNQDAPAQNESAIQESEASDSPPASGSSDPLEDDGSSRTSTPSQLEEQPAHWKTAEFKGSQHQNNYTSAYSRSYHSTTGNSVAASSAPNESSDMYYYRQSSKNRRPSTASHPESEDYDLTAAAESLVSCSLGTPRNAPATLPPDVPPVPPLPAKFQQSSSRPISFGYQTDVDMSDGEHLHTRRRDEEDEGMFGHMDH